MASGRRRGLETLLTTPCPFPLHCRPGLCLQPHCVSDHTGSQPAYLQRCADAPCPALPSPAEELWGSSECHPLWHPRTPRIGCSEEPLPVRMYTCMRACDPRTPQAAAGGWPQTHGHPDLHNGHPGQPGSQNKIVLKTVKEPGRVAATFNPAAQETEAGESVSSSPA